MMIIAVLAPFITAALAPLICRASERIAPWLLATVPLAIFLYVLSVFPSGPRPILSEGVDWFPQFGVRFDYRLDGLSGMFALLITGIGCLVTLYAAAYFGPKAKNGRFYAYFFAFMGAMLGVVLSDNLIGMFVFWELTSVTSFLLIGFKHATKSARDSALQALLITGLGGLALLAGLILLALAAVDSGLTLQQAMQFSALSQTDVKSHAMYPAILGLILLGAFTKSAQFPFHFWLPGAMAAPTPVSSYLHSATMVKAGVFLLARLLPILGGTTLWITTVATVGGVTMLVGAVLALLQRDLKLILAFSTVSVLGTLTFLLGIGDEAAVTACVVYLIAHAFYKASLFQVAGIIDLQTGTRDVTRLGGLMRLMPITMGIAVLAAMSMAGIPPFFGFYGKELLYGASLATSVWKSIAVSAALFAAILTVVAALTVALRPFIGHSATTKEPDKSPRDGSWLLLLAPGILAAAGCVFGLAPLLLDRSFLTPMALSISTTVTPIQLALWHGLDGHAGIVVALSLATFIGGGVVWRLHGPRIASLNDTLNHWKRFGFEASYRHLLNAVYRETGRFTRTVQNGYLRHYIAATLIFAVGVTAVPIFQEAKLMQVPADAFAFLPLDLSIALMILSGVIFVALTRKRLSAVAGLGLIGLGVVLYFTMFSAPDLALTQVLVEVLTVVLFVGVFYHLPNFATFTRPLGRARDLLLAASVGGTMAVFVLISQSVRLDDVLTTYFSEKSLAEAFGQNVVNVILVDFRALDTMGEVIVVAIAGFGIFSLLSQHLRTDRKDPR